MHHVFFCMVNILKDFSVTDVARKKSRVVQLTAIPRGKPAPTSNPAVEITPVITADVRRPVSRTPLIALNPFIFLSTFNLQELQSHLANMPRLYLMFITDIFVTLVVP